MDGERFGRKLFLFLFLCNVYAVCTTTEVCSNSILPGAKGTCVFLGHDVGISDFWKYKDVKNIYFFILFKNLIVRFSLDFQ